MGGRVPAGRDARSVPGVVGVILLRCTTLAYRFGTDHPVHISDGAIVATADCAAWVRTGLGLAIVSGDRDALVEALAEHARYGNHGGWLL